MTETAAQFRTDLATARAAYFAASNAVDAAVQQTAPMPAEIVEWSKAKNPARHAQMEADVAALAATLPTLRATLAAAGAEMDRLDAMACHRCHGRGEYQGPTSHFKNGKAVCFACHGDGRSAAARKAANASG